MRNLREIVKTYIYDFVGNGIYDIIKFLFTLIVTTFIGTGIIHKVLDAFFSNVYIVIGISSLTTILLLWLFIVIYQYIRKYKFRIKIMEINFEYRQDRVIVVSNIQAKALRKGLDRIYNRYTWFPDEKTRLFCLNKEFTIERLPKKDTSNEYYVKFNRILKKGEIIKFTTKIVNANSKRHFGNFYSREIITPIDKLKLTVTIPSQFGFKYISKQVIKGSAYDGFLENEKVEFLNTYTWEIDKPKLGFEYKLLWEKQ